MLLLPKTPPEMLTETPLLLVMVRSPAPPPLAAAVALPPLPPLLLGSAPAIPFGRGCGGRAGFSRLLGRESLDPLLLPFFFLLLVLVEEGVEEEVERGEICGSFGKGIGGRPVLCGVG